MIKVAVLEDEKLACESMVQLISKYPQLELAGTFRTAKEFMKHIKEFDVVFVDVKLPSESGLSIARRLKGVGIVFVTAYEQYAAQAFEIGAIDYLVKPVRGERFALCVERIIQTYSKPLVKLPVKEGKDILMLDFDKILYIEALGKKCIAVTPAGEFEVYRWGIGELEKRLPSNFLRTHKSYICNLDKVRRVIRVPNMEIELDDSSLIPVSRHYQRFVKSSLFL
ncbi:MAG TPA: LytTR family DNA-binding domain-containing protein [Pseudothermotoga sp.]|nr:LytTR family DNA-binding domain-containing protein [Pseudothermotoga sp.]HOK84137.1 LytTR family DNA-binding domain-containing protein [Pseudothermotoga sp.]HPP69136.1 LytTR family DNA-binding domain-containing protein [Pseudothermotoga sp.]